MNLPNGWMFINDFLNRIKMESNRTKQIWSNKDAIIAIWETIIFFRKWRNKTPKYEIISSVSGLNFKKVLERVFKI